MPVNIQPVSWLRCHLYEADNADLTFINMQQIISFICSFEVFMSPKKNPSQTLWWSCSCSARLSRLLSRCSSIVASCNAAYTHRCNTASGLNMSRMNWRQARTWLKKIFSPNLRSRLLSLTSVSDTWWSDRCSSRQRSAVYSSLNHFCDQKKQNDADCFLWGRRKKEKKKRFLRSLFF